MTEREKILITIAKMQGRTCLVINVPTISCIDKGCDGCPYSNIDWIKIRKC